jgi:hypothetical protein
MKYARVLLGHCPQVTTGLFIDYYAGRFHPKQGIEQSKEEKPQPAGGAVQNLAALLPIPYMNPSASVNTNVGQGTKSTLSEPQLAVEVEQPVSYEIPKPRTAFSSFVDHPQEFVTFLEALIKQENLKEEDKVDLYTTLFEMYLDTANRVRDEAEKREWEMKAKQLIQGKDVSKTRLITRAAVLYMC